MFDAPYCTSVQALTTLEISLLNIINTNITRESGRT